MTFWNETVLTKQTLMLQEMLYCTKNLVYTLKKYFFVCVFFIGI